MSVEKTQYNTSLLEKDYPIFYKKIEDRLSELWITQDNTFDFKNISIDESFRGGYYPDENWESINIPPSSPQILVHELIHAISSRHRYSNAHPKALWKTGFSTKDSSTNWLAFTALNEWITDIITQEIIEGDLSWIQQQSKKVISDIISDDFYEFLSYQEAKKLVKIFIHTIVRKRKESGIEKEYNEVWKEIQRHYFQWNIIWLRRVCDEIDTSWRVYSSLLHLQKGKYYVDDDISPIEELINFLNNL